MIPCGLILIVLHMEMFVPTPSTSACVETSSRNSGGIVGHLLGTALDLTAQELMDGRTAHKARCQGLHGNSVSRIVLLGNSVLICS